MPLVDAQERENDERGRGVERAERGGGRLDAAVRDSSGGIPDFPPGPGDGAAWARVLELRPDLAPALTRKEEAELAVRGLAHGIPPRVAFIAPDLPGPVAPPRVDALRALGNAVVPAQAAAAFKILYRRIVE